MSIVLCLSFQRPETRISSFLSFFRLSFSISISLSLSLSLFLFLFFSSTMVIISIFALCFYISFEFSFLVKVLFATILFVILELEDIFDCKEKQIQQEREA